MYANKQNLIIKHKNYTLIIVQVDVFSFGVVMWELLTGEEPYASMHCGAIIGEGPSITKCLMLLNVCCGIFIKGMFCLFGISWNCE